MVLWWVRLWLWAYRVKGWALLCGTVLAVSCCRCGRCGSAAGVVGVAGVGLW